MKLYNITRNYDHLSTQSKKNNPFVRFIFLKHPTSNSRRSMSSWKNPGSTAGGSAYKVVAL